MNLVHYILREVHKHVRSFVYPDSLNCWIKMQTHDWDSSEPEPGWATAECKKCGRVMTANI